MDHLVKRVIFAASIFPTLSAIMTPAPCDLGNTPEAIKASIINHVRFTLGAFVESASPNDWWVATCLAVRDRVMDSATKSRSLHRQSGVRRVHYLSLEYLHGPSFGEQSTQFWAL